MPLHDDTPGEERIGRRDLTEWSTAAGHGLARLAGRLATYVSAHSVLVITAVVGAVLVVALTAAATEIYEAVEDGNGVAGLDRPVLSVMIGGRNATTNAVITGFTHLGGSIGMTIITVIIVTTMTVLWRSRTPIVLMVIAVAGSLAMTTVGKALVGRVRPPRSDAIPPFESSPSFPSGHTLNSTVIAGMVAYLLLRRLTTQLARVLTVVLAAGWAVAMGLSRVYLGHHWLTDVMCGWVLGLAWLAAVITAHRMFLTARRSRRERALAAAPTPTV